MQKFFEDFRHRRANKTVKKSPKTPKQAMGKKLRISISDSAESTKELYLRSVACTAGSDSDAKIGENGIAKGQDGPPRPRKKQKMKNGRLSKVPIVEVSKKNIQSVWSEILMSLRTCDFLALDLEFTGLGERKHLFCKSVEDRYMGAKTAAESRSVLSIGIATFKLQKHDVSNETKRVKLYSKVFNVLTLSDSDFSCEPGSLAYLARSNFDFCKVFLDGIPYSKTGISKTESPVRQLISEIFNSGKPIVVHNGLLDTVFLYGNFYSPLPQTSGEFLKELSTLLGNGGIYDSKYLTEFELKLPASYLEYLFRFCQRENAKEAEAQRVYLSVEFEGGADQMDDAMMTSYVDCPLAERGTPTLNVEEKDLCVSLANHGFCSKESTCQKSHDLDEILDFTAAKKEKKRQKNRKRRISDVAALNGEASSAEEAQKPKISKSSSSNQTAKLEREACSIRQGVAGVNRAGFDAFMTGFSVAFGGRMGLKMSEKLPEQLKNCLYLSGKAFPLKIQGSNYIEKSG